MQKITRTLFSLLVLVAYMVTTIGFGVHECRAKGTKHILLINSDIACEEIHQNCSCNSEVCSVDKHSSSCCSTETYHLDLDYVNNLDDSNNSSSFEPFSIYFPTIQLDISHLVPLSLNGNLEIKHGPPLYSYTKAVLATLAQWRL